MPNELKLPHGCCQTPRRRFQWKPKAQSKFARPGLRAGETSSQTHLPTTSATSYCLGNRVRKWFKIVSVDRRRFLQCRTNSACAVLLVFETDDGRTFAGADASL